MESLFAHWLYRGVQVLDQVIASFGLYVSSEAAIPSRQVQALQTDDLAWLILGVTIAVCALLVLSLPGAPRATTFFLLMVVFAFSTYLLVSTTNLIGFLVLWEFTALSAWGIGKLGLHGSNPVLGALPVNALGSLSSVAMFSFVALLVVQNGTFEMAAIETSSPPLMMALLLVAIVLKVFGLLSTAWLEGKRVAFPISNALLAGGAVTVVGIYPFLRFAGDFVRASHDAQSLALWGSLALALLFALAALREQDLYRIASFLAFVQFCLALAGLSVVSRQSVSGSLFAVVTYSAAAIVLFLAVGIISESTSARSLDDLGGLVRQRPALALLFLVAILAAGGLPPFGTFVGKITSSLAMLAHPDPLVGIAWIASWTVTALFLVRALAVALVPPSPPLEAAKGHAFSIVPIALGTSFLLLAAIWPNLVLSYLAPAVSTIVGW